MSLPRIALIGCGNMGRSLAGGLIQAGWTADALQGVDPQPFAGLHRCLVVRFKPFRPSRHGYQSTSLPVSPQAQARRSREKTMDKEQADNGFGSCSERMPGAA